MLHHVISKEDVIEVIFLHQQVVSNEEDSQEEVLIVQVVSREESQFQDEQISS